MASKSIYFVIDTHRSSSLNIPEICQTIRDIIIQSPPNTVKFSINVFSPLKKLVSQQLKEGLDINRVVAEIHAHCSGSFSTGLYDAWGYTMNEIPYCDGKSDYTHLVVFTQQIDNCSIIYNLDSVTNLLNEKLQRNRNMHCTLVDMSGTQTSLQNALNEKCTLTRARCNVMTTLAVPGIQMSLQSLKSKIQLQINSTSSAHGFISGNSFQFTSSTNSLSGSVLTKQQILSRSRKVNNNFCTAPRTAASIPIPMGQSSFVCNGITKNQPIKAEQVKAFKVWVGNIPMIDLSEVSDFLQQWGPCRIETINGNPTQWAVVAYYSEKSAVNAVKFGNGGMFHGHQLNINKI